MTDSRRENAIPMIVINKLTKPGDIRRVDLMPDTVRIQTRDGQDRVYKLVKGDNNVYVNEAYSAGGETEGGVALC